MTFATTWLAVGKADAKSKTPLEPYICWWSFDSNICKKRDANVGIGLPGASNPACNAEHDAENAKRLSVDVMLQRVESGEPTAPGSLPGIIDALNAAAYNMAAPVRSKKMAV